MEVYLIVQERDEPPALRDLSEPVVNLTANQVITFCLLEGGMSSGEPSVIIVSENVQGTVILQTSLDKFLTSASTMASIAEDKWGWERPEGHATLMPPSKEVRREMLEKIKKELEEWDDAENDG